MKTLILGSGMSVLEEPLGHEIDNNFNRVVRFKGFEDNWTEYIKHAGSKTTDLAFNTNSKTIADMKSTFIQSFWSEFDIRSFHMTYTSKFSMRRGLKKLSSHIGSKMNVVTYPQVRRFIFRYARDNNIAFKTKKGFTSGLIMIAYTLLNSDEFGNVYIHGFDSIHCDSNSMVHYYEPNKRTSLEGVHEIEQEAKVIQDMIDKETIQTLL